MYVTERKKKKLAILLGISAPLKWCKEENINRLLVQKAISFKMSEFLWSLITRHGIKRFTRSWWTNEGKWYLLPLRSALIKVLLRSWLPHWHDKCDSRLEAVWTLWYRFVFSLWIHIYVNFSYLNHCLFQSCSTKCVNCLHVYRQLNDFVSLFYLHFRQSS